MIIIVKFRVTRVRSAGKMHHWYHVDCLLGSFKTQRATSRSIASVEDIDGWSALGDLEREALLEKLQKEVAAFRSEAEVANVRSTNIVGKKCSDGK